MKFKIWHFILFALIVFSAGILSFSNYNEDAEVKLEKTNQLGDYWYQGLAEITSFTLDQNRYTNNHPGEVVLIQVTEDFLTDKQVKNDHYKSKNSIAILKTNLLKKFKTGIYDYSLMTSVFTSVDKSVGNKTLKTTFSSQDWCGHSFLQSNFRNGKYEFNGHSYFESEADYQAVLKSAVLEDEILNLIRINPADLPKGEFSIIPTSEYQRFNHSKLKVLKARASTQAYSGTEFQGTDLKEYILEYPNIKRKVSYYFEASSPYKIVGWKEVGVNKFTGKESISTAKRKKTILLDYWKKNGLDDTELRKKLDLDV